MSDPSKVQLGAHVHTWRAWKREQQRLWWEANKDLLLGDAIRLMAPLLQETARQPYLLERFIRRPT